MARQNSPSEHGETPVCLPIANDYTTRKDEELAVLAQSADDAAVNALFDRYAPQVIAYVGAILFGPIRSGALEIAISALNEALGPKIKHFDPRFGRFRAWLFTLVYTFAITEARKYKRVVREGASPPLTNVMQTGQPVDYRLINYELGQVLDQALGELSEDHRVVVISVFVLELTRAETAKKLDIPYGTVTSRLYYAFEFLRSWRGEHGTALSDFLR